MGKIRKIGFILGLAFWFSGCAVAPVRYEEPAYPASPKPYYGYPYYWGWYYPYDYLLKFRYDK